MLSSSRSQNFSAGAGSIAPQATPVPVIHSIQAHVRIIERVWINYRNRRIFRLLKHAIRAAEDFVAPEILRRICRREAELLSDPCIQVKVRLRFGGSSFPPLIFFKVYLCNDKGKGVKYITGKRMIQPSSPAARSACSLMGPRVFYDQMTVDTLHHQAYGCTDEIDVSTLKDYMKYTSFCDEMPARFGGRENSWRQLTLEGVPRHVIFYDVVDYIYSHKMSPALHRELPTLLMPPVNQEIQLKHMRILLQHRSQRVTPSVTSKLVKSSLYPTSSSNSSSARRSRQARQRASKMKSTYLAESHRLENRDSVIRPLTSDRDNITVHNDQNLDDEQVRQLYEWTRELSIEDFLTPRLVPH